MWKVRVSKVDRETDSHFKQRPFRVPRYRNALRDDSKEFGGTRAKVGVGRQWAGR